MGQVIALIKTFVGAVIPAVFNFVLAHLASIGVCTATLFFCMFIGVHSAILLAIVSLIVAVLCQKDSMDNIRKYYEEELSRQTKRPDDE